MILRVQNALVSYAKYIFKMIWPYKLSFFYPFPAALPLWQIIGAVILLLAISVYMVRYCRAMPFLLTGWLWYLGTLVPVIGIVQAGLWPAMAHHINADGQK